MLLASEVCAEKSSDQGRGGKYSSYPPPEKLLGDPSENR